MIRRKFKSAIFTLIFVAPSFGHAQSVGWSFQYDSQDQICFMSSASGPISFFNDGSGMKMRIDDSRPTDPANIEVNIYRDGDSNDSDSDTINATLVNTSGNMAAYSFDSNNIIPLLGGLLGVKDGDIMVTLGQRTITEPLDGAKGALLAMTNCVSDLPR